MTEPQPELLPRAGPGRGLGVAGAGEAGAGRRRRAGRGRPRRPGARRRPLAHLDRSFDYAVPATMADDARPGARVKVRFAGQDVDGFVLERCAHTDHDGRLSPLRRVVSAGAGALTGDRGPRR